MKWDDSLYKLLTVDILAIGGVVVNARERGAIDWRFVGMTAALLVFTGVAILWRVRRRE